MRSKRHHAVPQFYLKGFCGSDELLWLHDLKDLTAVKVNTEDSLVEKYLYSPETGENPHDDSIESMLAEYIDGPTVKPLSKLVNGIRLSDEERAQVALFIAFQEYRVPQMRDQINKLTTEIAQLVLDVSAQNQEYIQKTLDKSEYKLSEDDIKKTISAIIDGKFEIKATKVSWLHAMRTPIDIASTIYNMPWAIITAPEGFEFLTSDVPVVKILTDRDVPNIYSGGWLSPSAEGTFALNTKTCLAIRPDGIEGTFVGERIWCKDVNQRLILSARRFVISHRREEFVEKIARRRND